MQDSTAITDKSVFEVLMLDANIIIPFLDKNHTLFKNAQSELKRLFILEVDLVYSQPCLLEIINYWRCRLIFMHCLILVRNTNSLNYKFVNIIRNAESEFKNNKRNKYLYDYEIKEIRKLLSSVPGLWEKLVGSMNGKIQNLIKNLEKTNIVYAQFTSAIYPLSDKANWPKWNGAFSLIENYGLASNDAAILNMADYSTIHGFISNDGDIEFACSKGGYDINKLIKIS